MRQRIYHAKETAFTLVELLTVIAIIALLIGILIPSLSKARLQAKKVQSSAQMKGIGEGLELFKGDNEKRFRRSNGYPPSLLAEDQAFAGDQPFTTGAHWLVRYLLGNDLLGYAPFWNVPTYDKTMMFRRDSVGANNGLEAGWYDKTIDSGNSFVTERLSPYLESDAVSVKETSALFEEMHMGAANHALSNYKAPVFVDSFNTPILYYVANPAYSNSIGAPVASFNNPNLHPDDRGDFDENLHPGVFSVEDNAPFTGRAMCRESDGTCLAPDFDPFMTASEAGNPCHPLGKFISGNTFRHGTFNYYVLDQKMIELSGEATNNNSITVSTPSAVRKNTYLLISAGPDLVYGTEDDVKNF